MKWMFSFALSIFITFGYLMASNGEVVASIEVVNKNTNVSEKQKDGRVVNQFSTIEKKINDISPKTELKCGMPRCYNKNKKPATMEDEAMRRAKVFHRGLPIEGCAPLGPEEHKKRFEEEKRKLKSQKKETPKAQ